MTNNSAATSDASTSATEQLDRQSDTLGLTNIRDDKEGADDWTDVKHSERKKRDRLLDDRVLLGLVQKSDREGFKRLFTNLAILLLTAYVLSGTSVFRYLLARASPAEDEDDATSPPTALTLILFLPLYLFYGFQIQCFGYCAQHELMHRTAFRTRWINDALLFLVSVPCFEFGKHEKVMHKQHHTYTNDVDRDPELTSFWTPEELANPEFRKVSSTRADYLWEFFSLTSVMRSHFMRIINSARGIPVDYTGTGWSLKEWTYTDESGILRDLATTARMQILLYAAILVAFGRTPRGRMALALYWLVPAVLGFVPINFVRNAEHSDCEVSKEMNCLRNTRSCRSNPVMRQLMWNMNYHAEHHTYPMVPFFNLPKLSELLEEQLEHNDVRHFTAVNWEYAKEGGWIDQQRAGLADKKSS